MVLPGMAPRVVLALGRLLSGLTDSIVGGHICVENHCGAHSPLHRDYSTSLLRWEFRWRVNWVPWYHTSATRGEETDTEGKGDDRTTGRQDA